MEASAIRRVAAALVAIGMLALGAGYAFGASETVTAASGQLAYSKAAFTIDAGQVASFSNPAGNVGHTMTASDNGPDGKPLFDSDTVAGGAIAPAPGTQYLAPGTYHFFCKIHGPSMSADLIVSANGTALPRPSVRLKVLSAKVGKVVKSRKLKVMVTALTASQDVELSASKGAKKLAKPLSGLNLAAGASRTVKLNVASAVGSGLIGDQTAKAKVKVQASVPFGAPVSAKRTLR